MSRIARAQMLAGFDDDPVGQFIGPASTREMVSRKWA